MSYQIVKKLRVENDEIVCEMASNNVSPRIYYEWRRPNNEQTIAMIRRFIVEREWQPTNKKSKFVQSLNITNYSDGTIFKK